MSASQDSEFPEPDSMTVDPANLGSVDPWSVEGIFLVALAKSGSERDAFLSVQCVDASQRQRVEALLLAYEQAGNFLQKPAVAVEATPIGQYLDQCALPGTLGKLGPYEILEEIGRGGMGVVFRAHDPKLQRIVAVKALAPELARLPSARQRFLREARAAAAVSHPHVVTIFAVEGTEEASLGTERTTLPYLVMECIVGQTLHDKIKRVGALKVEEIIRISRQIAEGLTAAHKRGLIHRDIKPANILLENGVERVKITDFGLARTTSDGGITHTGEILGTPQCMSPEQARGEIVDQRSDLFSLGCVMYTMCTGVSPFRADNMLAVMKKVCEDTPTPVSQLNAGIPEWLCSLVHALLEKLPASRIQSAEEVVQCLESQAVANGLRTAQKTSDKKIQPSSRQHPGEEVPHWLLTPIIRGLKRLFFSDGQPVMTLIAILIGFLVGVEKDRESVILMLPMAGAIGLGLLTVLKACLKAPWHWLNWKAMILVPLGLFLGGVSRVWLIHTSQSGVGRLEEVARNNAGWLIFPLAITIFWLLNRWFPQLFIQNRSPQPNTSASTFSEVAAGQKSASAAVRPRTPWVIVEWVIVATLGIAVLSSLGFATVWIVSYLPAPGEITPYATCVIRTPVAENVKYVTIDGKQAILEPGGPGEWRTTTDPGTHGIYVAYDSDSVLNQERFFTTTINAERGKATIITAEPVMVRSLTRPAGIEVPISVPDSPKGPMDSPPGELTVNLESSSANPSNAESTATIPLSDAVEVLADVENWPRNSYRTATGAELKTQVWIDEPGLVIRLKPLDFEGKENSDVENVASCDWGSGFFKRLGDTNGFLSDFTPGRYRVLVQDLDYGWDLDRRGTIVIGQEKQTIHVKRSFVGQQMNSAREGATFRWKGRSYELKNREQVDVVNQMLAQLSGAGPVNGVAFDAQKLFADHPLIEQLSSAGTPGTWLLKYNSRTMKLEIPTGINVESVIITSDRGHLTWNRSVANGFAIPAGALRYEVIYNPGFGWPGVYDAKQFEPDALPNQTLIVGGLTKDAMREKVIANQSESGKHRSFLRWFNQTSISLDKHAVPAAERLVLAWLDGQPDVAETELLEIGKSESWEKLWYNGRPEDEHMMRVIEPGIAPGTWRMKEPPEGALAPN